ncbi:MAG: hypothetical protein Kow0076_8360 [Francisella sp.]
MNEALKEHNLNYIRQIQIEKFSNDTINTIYNFLCSVNKPIVIKPAINSGGTEGVCIINDLAGIKNYIEQNNNYPYLVQEYIEGTEYIVDVSLFKGKYEVGFVGEYSKSLVNGVPEYNYATNCRDKEKIVKLQDFAHKCLQACDRVYGMYHVEIMQDKNGECFLIEINPRHSGGKGVALQMSSNINGYDQIDLFFKNYVDVGSLNCKNHNKIHVIFYLKNKFGCFKSINEDFISQEIKTCSNYCILQHSCDISPIKNTLLETVAFLYLESNSLEDINNDIEKLNNLQYTQGIFQV